MVSILDELQKIGYFDLIENDEKRRFLAEKIDFDFKDDSNQYIGKGWLTFPNDFYISSVHNLEEYKNGSPTSDFRAFEVWPSSLFGDEFVGNLKSARVVFERNGLELEWKDEVFDSNPENIYHRITVNNKEYVIFSGKLTRENRAEVMMTYLNSFRRILNDVTKRQNKKFKIVLVTQPEHIVFVVLDNEKLIEFTTILSHTKNRLEE